MAQDKKESLTVNDMRQRLQFIGMDEARRKSRIERVVDLCVLESVLHKPIGKLSKGFRQRVGMAQALLHEPEVIFLDEPTDGLDPVGRTQVRTVLQELRDQGRTIFLNSHLLQEVELVCDRVAIMDKGDLRYVGTIEDLTPTEEAQLAVECRGPLEAIRAALAPRPLLEVSSNGDKHTVVLAGTEQ